MKTKISKKMYVLPLLLVVFLSGCVTGGGGDTGSGLIIKSFIVEPLEVFKNEQVFVDVVLENNGRFDAKNIRTHLETNTRLISLRQFSLLTNTLPGLAEGLQTAPSTSLQTDGRVLEEPLQTEAHAVPITLYVSYDYETEVAKTIAITDTQAQRLEQDGGALPVNAELSGGQGPVSLSIESLDIAKAGPNRELTVNLKLQNTGSGTVTQNMGTGAANRDFLVRLDEFQVLGNNLGTCNVNRPDVRVTKGRSSTVTCSINLPSDVDFTQSALIRAKVSYTYRVDSQQSVTIKGSQA